MYTGHISDRKIVMLGGFSGGIGLNILPFLGMPGQMNAKDVVKIQSIALMHVHVERTINKIKNFRIWDGIIPLNLFGILNQV